MSTGMYDDRILILLNAAKEDRSEERQRLLSCFRAASAGKPCFRCRETLGGRPETYDLEYAPYCSFDCQSVDMLDKAKAKQRDRFDKENRLAERLDSERLNRLDAAANERMGDHDRCQPDDRNDPGIPKG